MQIEHIIWDWNGTILDDAAACVETLNIILEKRQLREVTIDGYRENFGFPVKSYYEKLGFNFDVDDWDDMSKKFHEIYYKVSRKQKLRVGITEVLQRAKILGISMSVLSASEELFLKSELKRYGVGEYFEHVCGLTDIYAHSKLEAGKRLMADIALPSQDTLLIGDTIHDYEVAQEMLCNCVLIAGGHQAESRLRQCECDVFSNLNDLKKKLFNN